ncbi:hypothetical protein [Rufibacter psychrotolerans]|uniref:hypothetical protein n=1 Tax=Rufibacter psychrotolerans TaxID=2812556 RepID=UPI001968285F|nr:hypothetical protein [Rufibacter sp. SYSU D00308]
MNSAKTPYINAFLPGFRRGPVQVILAWLLLLSFGMGAVGCKYYRLREDKTPDAQKVAGLPNYKRFILHQGTSQWELVQVAVKDEAVIGKLQPLPTTLLPYVEDHPGVSKRYREAEKGTALHVVHLYVYEFARGENDQVTIPMSAIKRMDIADKDTGATIASHVLVGIAAAAATMALTAVIVALLKSSCPFIYLQDGEQYRFVGEAYGGAIFSPLERDDFMPLPQVLAPQCQVHLKITNELKERQFTNLAQLEVVDHPPHVRVLLDQTGQPHSLENPQAPLTALAHQGQDLTPVLAARDSAVWSFNQPDNTLNYLQLGFKKPQDAQWGKLVLHVQNTLWLDYLYGEFTRQFGGLYNSWAQKQKDEPAAKLLQWQREQGIPLLVEVQTPAGWQVVERIPPVGPLASRDLVIPIPLAHHQEDTVQVRLSCGFMFWEIDQAGMDFSPNLPLRVKKAPLTSAYAANGQQVKQLLTASDAQYLQQANVGNAVELTFAVPRQKAGQRQAWFLHTRGYYEHIRAYEGIPNLISLREFAKPGRFMQFSRERYLQLMKDNNLTHLVHAHAPTR